MLESDQYVPSRMDLSNLPVIPESALDFSRSIRLPLDDPSLLGAAFTALPELLRQAPSPRSISEGSETLYRALDAAGNVIPMEKLQTFNKGIGYLGSIRENGTFAQVHWSPVSASSIASASAAEIASATTSAINPALVFMAAMLVQVNQKLDAISETQEKMFAYAKQRDHAKLKGAFKVLDELRENYRYNSDNSSYLSSRHHLVATAWRDAENAMELQRERLRELLEPLGPLHAKRDVAKRTNEILEVLRDYQLSSYLYCYATLLDVALVGNFDAAYLKSVADKMERYSTQYFKLYGKCADRIESDAKGSIGSSVASGFSAATGALSKFIASTPVGDITLIDEALEDGSNALDSMVSKDAESIVGKLAQARPGFMRPFIEEIQEMDRLHNEPVIIVVGGDSAYVMPLESDSESE
ncbi:MAG: hypothetical protein Q4B54_08430 [Coriobacteriales bacterium]|nr:hypothetical protein [Coriobacteriales bacterium]